jgi:hypothetical protein
MRWNQKQGQLSLNEGLLEALGYPKVFIVESMGTQGIVLYQRGDPRASGKERRVNYPQRASPRLSIGQPPATELGLVHGAYWARIEEEAIYARPA